MLAIFELLFCKKIPLSRRVEYVMDGSMDQSVSEWVSQWVRDEGMSHQSDRIYYKQPIKFLVLKVNSLWEDSILIQFRTAIFILLWKSRKYLFPHFLWVMLKILVMDEMSLEVWDSPWACCMQMVLDIFIFSSKSNMILLFFTRSKFNYRSRIVAFSSLDVFEEATLFWFERVWTFTIVIADNDCFGLFACKYSEIFFYFWVTKGNLTLLFFKRE